MTHVLPRPSRARARQDAVTIVAEQPGTSADVAELGDVESVELEMLKERVAQKMVMASLDGTLQGALEALQWAKPAKPAKPDVDDLRLKLARQLKGALADGSLEDALSIEAAQRAKPGQKHTRQADDEALRERVASQLEKALTNGSLEAALQSVKGRLADGSAEDALRIEAQVGQGHGGQTDDEDLRERVAAHLEKAFTDGSLEAALQSVKGVLADGPAEEPLSIEEKSGHTHDEDLRERVAAQLEKAFSDGSLEAALQVCVVPKNAQGAPHGAQNAALPPEPGLEDDVEALRQKLALRLEASVTDGSLEAVLAEQAGEAARDPEDLREKMGSQLLAALQDGSLEAALEANAAAVEEDSSDRLRSKLATSLSQSFLDGSLELALSTGTSLEIEPSKLQASADLFKDFNYRAGLIFPPLNFPEP